MWKLSKKEEHILKCIRENAINLNIQDNLISISVNQKELVKSQEFKEAVKFANDLFQRK